MSFGKYKLLLIGFVLISVSSYAQTVDPVARKKSLQFLKAAEVFTYQGSTAWLSWLDSAHVADPMFGQPFVEKARVYNMRGDFAEGFKQLNEAIKRDSVSYLGYQGWYKIYYLRDYEGGRADLLRTDALTPKTIDYPGGDHIYYLLGMAESGLGNLDKALEYFERYAQDETTRNGEKWVRGIAYLRMIDIYYRQNALDLAMSTLEKVMNSSPNMVEAHYLKGIVALKMADKATATKSLYRALELFLMDYEPDRWLNMDDGYPLTKEIIQEKLAQATGIK